jgi:hypothetical protein
VVATPIGENNERLWLGKDVIDETKLIKLVQNYESIWNMELKNEKKNLARRKLAWSEIERDFNCKLVPIANRH